MNAPLVEKKKEERKAKKQVRVAQPSPKEKKIDEMGAMTQTIQQRAVESSGIRRYITDKYIMQHFKPLKVIGKGSFGEVTKAIDLRTSKVRAIKKIKKSAI